MRRFSLPYDGSLVRAGVVQPADCCLHDCPTERRRGDSFDKRPGGMPCNVVRRGPCATEDERDK
jgi:hypothetical protein